MLRASIVRQAIVVAAVGCWWAGAGALPETRLNAGSPSSASARPVGGPQQSAGAAPTIPPSPQRALLNRYCVSCHNERSQAAGLMLDKLDVDHVSAAPETWEKVVVKLRSGAMPPPGVPRPDTVAYASFTSWLETALDDAAAASPNAGRPAVHRLNRAEYTNAIRDLLEVEIDARSLLPVDDSSYGFDNIADVLSVSPTLLDRYLAAAQKISRVAIGDPAVRPFFETYHTSNFASQEDRISDDLPFGSRGGLSIRHHFPVDGEYVLKVSLRRNEDNCCAAVLGLDHRNQLEVRVDGTRVELFSVGGVPIPDDTKADEGLVVRFRVKAGTRQVGVAFVKRTAALTEGVGPERLPMKNHGAHTRANLTITPGVDHITIEGPYDTAGVGDTRSRRRIFVCRPTGGQDDAPCAKTILSTIARRAYRRPVTDQDVRALLGFFQAGRKDGGFEAGIELALRSILVDPEFLFRIDKDPAHVAPGTAYRISDFELASRLSFFLWSSIPDDDLLDAAGRGTLANPVVLEQQVRRMLADTRASALVSNFAGQWLHLRDLRVVKPDAYLFPDFDDSLREGFQRETELFVESQVREDRSVVDLLTANYSFLNNRLARHYQVPGVYGSHFRRVNFDEHSVRGGLLAHGSVLTVTSYPDRTSPTQRGKWLLENVLGLPPPPPPPDVPSLEERGKETKPLAMRERMEQHRTNPICASCHRQMDPLGFALENFDAIGRWRTTADGTTPLDVSGALPDGTRFTGPVELRNLLTSRRQEFVFTVTEKLFTYALGSGLQH
jgi:hypothetical protein